MRRHLFIVVSAMVVVLGVFFAADCGETGGTGGTGGPGGAGGVGGTGGIAGSGGSGGVGGGGTGGTPKCDSAADCDDKNECTTDVCDTRSGSCTNSVVQDGSPCGGETHLGDPRGGCYAGYCNFVPVSVTVGQKEVVFDWTTERCEDLDIPDGPAKAVRAEDGEIVIFATLCLLRTPSTAQSLTFPRPRPSQATLVLHLLCALLATTRSKSRAVERGYGILLRSWPRRPPNVLVTTS